MNRLRLALVLASATIGSHQAGAGDWPTFGHDPQRSGWARNERTLSPGNVSALELLWKTKVENEASLLGSLTAPVAVAGVTTTKGIRDADLIVCKQVLAAYLENLTGTSMAPLIGKRDGKLEFPKEV